MEPENQEQEIQEDPVEGDTENPEPEEETKHEPPVGSKRWNKLYYENKESKRQLEALNKEFSAYKEALIEIKKHNQALAEKVGQSINEEKTKLEKANIDSITTKLRELRKQKAKALEESNYLELSNIESEIDDLNMERYRASIPKFDKNKIVNELKAENEQVVVKGAVDNFIANTPWFNTNHPEYDQTMAAAAVGLDQSLPNKFGSVTERFNEIKRIVEERFMYKGSNQSNNSRIHVEGAGGPVPKSKDIELTAEEIRVAKLMFPDNPKAIQIYKDQKRIINNGK